MLIALAAPAVAADDALSRLAGLIARVEAQRAAARAPADRRALTEAALPRYREHAALLAAAGRGADAFAAAELAKTRALLDLSAAARALEAGPLPGHKASLLDEMRAPSAEELRGLLPPDAAYLSYVVQRNVFLLIVVSSEAGGEIHRLPLAPSLTPSIAALRFLLAIPESWRGRIANLPKAWRRGDGSFQVAAKPPEPGAREVADADEVAAWLGEKLLAPAAKRLAAARQVIVSPDADLAFVPFEALRLEGRHLVETHEVRYASTAGLYALSRARAGEYRRLEGRAEILAFGGALYEPFVQVTPMLNVHHDLLYALPRQLRKPEPREPLSTVPDAFRALKVTWANLPGTAEEAARVAGLFASGRVLSGPDASEQRLLELNASGELARYRHLFFATHGYLSPYDARLSSVVLSQVGNPPSVDGYVTAAEWPRYDLRSDLVVVSAANSGFGPVARGEGLLGLPFALHLAGNRNAVVSLWTLNDPLTAKFVEQFFARVRNGEDHGSALAETKRGFIADGVSPSYWAPFVLHGS